MIPVRGWWLLVCAGVMVAFVGGLADEAPQGPGKQVQETM
jgi:hypothetical protein